MSLDYSSEIGALDAVVQATLVDPPADVLALIQRDLLNRPLTAVASGGAFPAARLAADWHVAHTGRFAEALTPLAYEGTSLHDELPVVLLLSARARHPDTAAALRTAISRDQKVVVVSQRRPSELKFPFQHPSVTVLTIPQTSDPDGFLATQSLVAMITCLARMYAIVSTRGGARIQPMDAVPLLAVRQRLLVLHGKDERFAAEDVDARFSETGLAAVQLADYRSLAHGRHLGLWRHLDETTVVALVGPRSESVAHQTLSVLPGAADVRTIATTQSGFSGVLELLTQTMSLPIATAREQGVRIERPGVPDFGRRLYHLSTPRAGAVRLPGPVARKLAASGAGRSDEHGQVIARHYDAWRRSVRQVPLAGILLDYDGTVVATADRYALPAQGVQAELIRLLGEGLTIGFASGRGDSLYRGLRDWVPSEAWDRVQLGMHNGGWRALLADFPLTPEPGDDQAMLADMAADLKALLPDGFVIRGSPAQLTVTGDESTGDVALTVLRDTLISITARDPARPVKVVLSGHSIDIIPGASGKRRVFEQMTETVGPLLVIGDQGEVGGNDHDLLAATRCSLSVDRCSGDPDRCWSVGRAGVRGPLALQSILAQVRRRSHHHVYLAPEEVGLPRPPACRRE